MGLLKDADLSLNDLIGYSKLQELLALILAALREQEEAIQPLQGAIDELRSDHQNALEQIQSTADRIDSQQSALSEAESRLDTCQAAVATLPTATGDSTMPSAMVTPEQLEELISRMDQYDELLKQLQAQSAELSSSRAGLEEQLKEGEKEGEGQSNAPTDSIPEQITKMNDQATALEKLISDLEKQFQDMLAQLASHESGLRQLQNAFGGEQGVTSLQASLEDLRREMNEGRVSTGGMLSVDEQEVQWVAQDQGTQTERASLQSKRTSMASKISSSPGFTSSTPGIMSSEGIPGTTSMSVDELQTLLMNELEQQVAISSKPLEAAIEALDAKIESQVTVRIEALESRVGIYPPEGLKDIGSTAPTNSDGIDKKEETSGKMLEIKLDIKDLSRKLNEVVNSLGDLQRLSAKQGALNYAKNHGGDSQTPGRDSQNQSGDSQKQQQMQGQDSEKLAEAYSAQQQLLSQASQQLEQRVASLESKLSNGPNASTQDMTEMSDSLKQVQIAASSLEGIVNKDVQPQLSNHDLEMRRLAKEYRNLCQRIEDMMSKSSMATSHCLSCFDTRKQSINKVITGSDGKAYLQGGHCPPNINVRAEIAWPPDMNGGLLNPLARKSFPEKIALQGGAGAPLRKYRIPLGTDGLPTWSLTKGQQQSTIGAVDRSASTGALDRVRGLPMRPTSSAGRALKADALIGDRLLKP